jgi:hypothetical protein
MKQVAALILCVCALVGCATTQGQLYYWGNYSTTLYNYTKEPTAKTLSAHKAELLSIVKVSESQHKKAPPGVLAELGDFSAMSGDKIQATHYFQQEILLYPESEKIINLALQKIQ